jgi:putative ABC transport system permease protein
MTLLFIVLAIGGVILNVINVFNIRERKYEVGVFTAMGIKKGKVAMQFVTELLCVTLIAIVIGAAVGAAVSVRFPTICYRTD